MGAGHLRGKSGGDGSQMSAKCSAHKGLSLELVTPRPNLCMMTMQTSQKSPDPWYSLGNPRGFQPETISKGYPGQHHSYRA